MLRFDVAPLSDAETDALVGAVLQGQVEGRTLRQIRQATGGNPLFLRELLISARETGVLDDNGGVWRAYGKLGVTGRADLRQALDLHRPIYQQTAAYGHFGRSDNPDFTWEQTGKADILREAAGLGETAPANA